jgi:ketosteroid isomerase-like protein
VKENVDLMLSFQSAFMTSDPEAACRRYLSADFELHEPPELPQGGVFKGPDAPLRVSRIYRDIWNVDFHSSELFDTEDPEIVVARYVITWTHRKTGKSMTQPVVELNRCRDGKIVRMDVFHFNPTGLIRTMIEEAAM